MTARIRMPEIINSGRLRSERQASAHMDSGLPVSLTVSTPCRGVSSSGATKCSILYLEIFPARVLRIGNPASGLEFWFSGITDPWVKQSVEHINNEVCDDEDN